MSMYVTFMYVMFFAMNCYPVYIKLIDVMIVTRTSHVVNVMTDVLRYAS